MSEGGREGGGKEVSRKRGQEMRGRDSKKRMSEVAYPSLAAHHVFKENVLEVLREDKERERESDLY